MITFSILFSCYFGLKVHRENYFLSETASINMLTLIQRISPSTFEFIKAWKVLPNSVQ